MKNESEKKNKDFFMMPLFFYDYGLQCFKHIEYDILGYILRNTIGWFDDRKECEISIKKIALMRHYSEKSIIKAINNLIKMTNVFSKIVYRDKGSCIKKTKYFITDNSVKILNDYVKQNIPNDFEEKKEKLKNRSVLAMERIEQEKQSLKEKQEEILKTLNVENETDSHIETITDFENENIEKFIEAVRLIINLYSPADSLFETFKEHKEYVYDRNIGYVPEETFDDKIDLKLSDLIQYTNDSKTISLYETLIKRKQMIGGQIDYFYNTLMINFGFKNRRNFERINVIYE